MRRKVSILVISMLLSVICLVACTDTKIEFIPQESETETESVMENTQENTELIENVTIEDVFQDGDEDEENEKTEEIEKNEEMEKNE